ncbi:MAG: Fic family protein [Planctomycetota bacterium]|jgi:Fic family protein
MLSQDKADYIYNSNTLDGITLNQEQTLWIVNGEIDSFEVEELEAPDGEMFETAVVTSHLDALNFVLGYPKMRPLAESIVKEIHTKLMHNVLVAPGEYREHNPRVPISFQVGHTEVPDLMKLLGVMLQNGPEEDEDQAMHAWKMHHELCGIYPFVNGNGRTARLLMNLIRVRFGMNFEVVREDDKETYYKMINDYIRRRTAD